MNEQSERTAQAQSGGAAGTDRIAGAFRDGKAFIGFVTAGDPDLGSTEEFILAMIEAGADLVEIGIPFSDPVAEGEVVQRANARALAAGTDIRGIFDLVGRVRARSQVPLVFLTYLNPLHFYGYDSFLARCRETGVDGLIIPDLPFEEREELQPYCSKYGVPLISLIAPTSAERTGMIARNAEGFIYCVSSMGVTGVRSTITTDLAAMIAGIRRETTLPIAVGFGISDPGQAAEIGALADGVIVGSAIVRIIENHGAAAAGPLRDYVAGMKQALKGIRA